MKWIPYPKAWKQAVILFIDLIPLSILSLILKNSLIRIIYAGAKAVEKTGNLTPFLTLIGVILLTEIYIIALAHQLFWYEPKVIPNITSWKIALISFLVYIIALIFSIGLTKNYLNYALTVTQLRLFFVGSCFVVSAYLFHLINLIFRRYDKPKIKNIDTVEQELNGMKGELGIKKMRDINKNN
jgi:hypothetical protein